MPYYDVIDNVVSSKDLDNLVQPVKRDLELSMLELRFYFESETYAVFVEIEKGLNEIYNTVSRLRGTHSGRQDMIARGNELTFTMEENFRNNERLIERVGRLVRKDFKMSL